MTFDFGVINQPTTKSTTMLPIITDTGTTAETDAETVYRSNETSVTSTNPTCAGAAETTQVADGIMATTLNEVATTNVKAASAVDDDSANKDQEGKEAETAATDNNGATTATQEADAETANMSNETTTAGTDPNNDGASASTLATNATKARYYAQPSDSNFCRGYKCHRQR